MRLLASLLVSLLLICAATAQDCVASGTGSVEGPPTDYPSLPPDYVLYIIIGTGYYSDMKVGYDKLVPLMNDPAYCTTGCSVQLHSLDSNAAAVPILDSFTQIWVGDLSAGADNSVNQMNSYQRIAAWWRNRGMPHLILDGRYLSSVWASGHTNRPNPQLIKNYFVNLRARGGGMFLGTDHAPAFIYGINEINNGIGVGPFINYYSSNPPYMEIDPTNSIMNFPVPCWCNSTTPATFLYDDASTSDVPYNLQANGLILYTVGWHNIRGIGNPGLGTTIRGNIGFLVNIVTPACHTSYTEGATISFTASFPAGKQGNPNYRYTWKSDKDGTLGTNTNVANAAGLGITKVLSVGVHTVTLTVTDSQGLTAQAKTTILVQPNDDDPEGPVVIVGNEVRRIYPIRRPLPAASYYGYGTNPAAATSANTPDHLENLSPATGQFFLYDDGANGLYIDHLFGSVVDSTNMRSDASISFSGIAGQAGSIVQRDDPTSNYFQWNNAAGSGSASFQWNGQTTGFVAGPLPYNQDFSIKYTFNKNVESGVKTYAVRSHASPSFALPNPSPIITHSWVAGPVGSLTISYRQLMCADTVSGFNTYTLPWGRVTNSIVKFGWNTASSNFNYPDTPCKFLVKPTYSNNEAIYGIAFYKQYFNQVAGDSVVLYKDNFVTTFGTYTSAAAMPATMAVLTTSAASFQHAPTNDAQTSTGFYVTYSVIPGLKTISPINGAYQQPTPITVSGFAVYNNGTNNLRCKIVATVAPNNINVIVPAVYVNNNTVTCVVPPGSGVGPATISISNDGITFSNTTTFNYFEGNCAQLATCGACTPVTGCSWCNDEHKCFAEGVDTCTGGVDDSCCTQCQQNEGCNAHGSCQCADTCTCSTAAAPGAPFGYQNENCSCIVCPSFNGQQCGGTVDDVPIGHCNCDGTCSCEFGHTGAACECLTCPGYPEACNGHGDCNCDGTCSCHAGWTNSTDPSTCDCSLECPTAIEGSVCSGHGSCLCGVCTCDAGFGVLEDCSCVERCTDDCSGNGACNCDGTCSCVAGYSGETCAVFNPCNYTDCTNCTLQTDCAWCVENGVCQNIYLPPDLSKCTLAPDNKPGNLTTVCPVAIVPGEPPVVNNTAIIAAAAVGGVAVAAAAAAIAAWLYKKKATGFLSSGENPFEGTDDGTMANPLYQMGNSGESAIYQQ